MKNLMLKSVLVSLFSFFAFANMNAQEVKPIKEIVETVETENSNKSECKKACCAAKEVKEGTNKVAETKEVTKKSCTKEDKKNCSKGNKKPCSAKKVAEAKTCESGCEKACCVG